MLTVLMLTIILTVIGLAAITTTTMDMKMAGSEMMRERGESAAESCMSSGVQIIQQTLANSAIPPALTAAGANPAVTAAPLQSEIMGYPGFEGLGGTDYAAPGGVPNAVLKVPTTNPLFNVNMDIDRLYAAIGAGSSAQASGGYEGTGGAAAVNIYYRIDCYATTASSGGQQVSSRITGVYMCKQTGDSCQRKI